MMNLINKSLDKSNKYNTIKRNDVIKFKFDNSNQKIIEFIIPVSKTKKIQLVRNNEKNDFEKIEIITNLQKKIIYKEGKIKQSLYRSASNQNIPANIIVEFARIYGFQVDFQRDVRKNDTFQIIYEVFEDEDKKFLILEIFYLQI